MAQIFISFSSLDKKWADAVANALTDDGISSYFHAGHHEQGIRAGADWERVLYSEMRGCSVFLPLLSEHWLASSWCHVELRLARFLGKFIYPVKLDACSTSGIADELQNVQLSIDRAGSYAQITRDLNERLRRRGAKLKAGLRPFPGLESFTEAYASVFFGRDKEIAELEAKLKSATNSLPVDQPRVVVLSGPSGVGKSSLVRAGLIPDLLVQPSGTGFLVLPPVRPRDGVDSGPESLTASLAGLIVSGEGVAERLIATREARALLINWPQDKALSRYLGDLLIARRRRNLLIFIDQAEELDEASEFAVKLDGLLSATDASTIGVFGVREERAVAVQLRYGGEIYTLGPMQRERMAEAVRGPLRLSGIPFQEAFVDEIVADAATGADGLPLMAQLLSQMDREGREFTLDAYRQTSGIAGAIQRAAETAFLVTATTEDEKTQARSLFVPLLVDVGPAGEVRLGRLKLDHAPPLVQPLIKRFIADRLLRTGKDPNGTYIEAAHESLLRRWERLKAWIEEDRENLIVLGQLERDAGEWIRGGRSVDLLLHRGHRLARALRLRDNPAYAGKTFERDLWTYLERCVAHDKGTARPVVSGMRGRVLIVDDIFSNVEALAAKFGAEYFEVITAFNGEQALTRVAAELPDIVLLDVLMPGMDGFEVCRRIKGNTKTAHIPVLIVTELDQPSDRVLGLDAGADDFLVKPVSDQELFARVGSLIRMKMMTDELRLREETGRSFLDAGETMFEADPKGNILVVDDRPESVAWIRAALETKNNVSDAAYFNDALERSRGGDLDLIVISLDILEFDGLRLCSHLRSLYELRNTPILVLVNEGESHKLALALDMGVNDYLKRPLDRNELIARVKTQLRKKYYADKLRDNMQLTLDMAITDELTGLSNRRYLTRHLETLIKGASEAEPISLLLADIDYLKSINDSLGRRAGDEVLREFAGLVSDIARGLDLPCRFRDDEFVIMMPATDIWFAYSIAERLRSSVEHTPIAITRAPNKVHITVSMGIASSTGKGDSSEKLLERADRALGRAKLEGRNRVIAAVNNEGDVTEFAPVVTPAAEAEAVHPHATAALDLAKKLIFFATRTQNRVEEEARSRAIGVMEVGGDEGCEKETVECEDALTDAQAALDLACKVALGENALYVSKLSPALRPALNAALGFSEMIEKQPLGPVIVPRYVEYARHVSDSACTLLLRLEEINDLANADSGKLDLVRKPTRLGDLLADTLRILEPSITRSEVKVELQRDAGSWPLVEVDAARLQRSLSNILQNAIRFTPAGGKVTVSGGCGGRMLKIAIEDTGVGIRSDDLSLVMRPISQWQPNAMGQGTGLGLPFAKAIIELHGGTLTIQSTQGLGTIVSVELPLAIGSV